MKQVYLILGTLFIILNCHAQSVNNTTDGTVNILAPHSIVGVSTNEGLVTASYFWYGDSSCYRKKKEDPYNGWKPVFGGQLQAKNESGIAAIFNKGDYTPTGKIGLTAGITHNNYQKIIEAFNSSELKTINKQIVDLRKKYADSINLVIDAFGKKNAANFDTARINSFKRELKKDNSKIDTIAKIHLLGDRKDQVLESLVKDLVKNVKQIQDARILKTDILNKQKKRVTINRYNRFAFFGSFSMQALTFKQYEARDTLVLSNNFTDKNFYGIDARIGFNYNIDVRWMFGTTIGFREWNTFETLTGKEYTLTTSSVSSNTTLKTEKKLTGYSGDYGEFNQFVWNIDVVCFLYEMKQPVKYRAKQINSGFFGDYNKEVKNIFGINPYFSLKNSLNKTVFPNVMTAGVNVFTFKPDGKYNVGFFVELYDIENNVAKMDPEANLRQGYQRLSFGIVTKLALSSMFSPAF